MVLRINVRRCSSEGSTSESPPKCLKWPPPGRRIRHPAGNNTIYLPPCQSVDHFMFINGVRANAKMEALLANRSGSALVTLANGVSQISLENTAFSRASSESHMANICQAKCTTPASEPAPVVFFMADDNDDDTEDTQAAPQG